MRILNRHGVLVITFCAMHCGCAEGPTGGWRPRDFYADRDAIALVTAVEKGDTETMGRLVSGKVDVNIRGKNGMTPLLWAMWAKNKDSFKWLLEHGADPNLQIDDGSSVTSFAAYAANDSEWLEVVLKHGANPNLVNPHGCCAVKSTTPIFDAILSRRQKNLELLVQAGANIDFQDAWGDTPMMFAAGLNWFDTVYWLLEAGADFRIKNKDGYNLAYCTEDSVVETGELGRWRLKVVDFLEKKGVDFARFEKKSKPNERNSVRAE